MERDAPGGGCGPTILVPALQPTGAHSSVFLCQGSTITQPSLSAPTCPHWLCTQSLNIGTSQTLMCARIPWAGWGAVHKMQILSQRVWDVPRNQHFNQGPRRQKPIYYSEDQTRRSKVFNPSSIDPSVFLDPGPTEFCSLGPKVWRDLPHH